MSNQEQKTKPDGGASVSTVGLGASSICSSVGMLKILLPVTIYWRPQPDITTYELARLLPIVFRHGPLMPYEVTTEPELLRHLEVHDPNAKLTGAARHEQEQER